MRTGSFSNNRVQKHLNSEFINTFANTTGDPTSGMSISHRPGEQAGTCVRGNGKQNVQTLFLTPEGEIYHVATGFLSANDLAEEANFAAELFSKIRDVDAPAEIVVAEHRQRLLDAGFDETQIANQSPMARMQMMAAEFEQMAKQGDFSSGSSSRNRPTVDPFRAFSKRQILEDNQFSIEHPLMAYEDLERDPTRLLGNGKSFFASSSSSN